MSNYSCESKKFSKCKSLGNVLQEAFKHEYEHCEVHSLYLAVECKVLNSDEEPLNEPDR